jgi:excisionase family DNA binding protein
MELMTVEEVASYFNVKPHTVRNWMRRGEIPKEAIFKIGATVRIKKNQLQDFIFKTA